MKMDTILVPTDFSDDATRALETAVDFARISGGRIVLLHAYSIDLPFTAPTYGGGVMRLKGGSSNSFDNPK